MKIRQLSREEHLRAADLSHRAQELLSELSRLVERAPYTDATLTVQRAVQERLIDPLREQWNEHATGDPRQANPYHSVHYAGGRRIR